MKYNFSQDEINSMSAMRRHYYRKRGVDIPKRKSGIPKGTKFSPAAIEKRKRFGPDHPKWKGDAVSVRGGRNRALRNYVNIGPCVECGSQKAERHHKDGNTANNSAENIVPLCRRCHMVADGRLEVFRKLNVREGTSG